MKENELFEEKLRRAFAPHEPNPEFQVRVLALTRQANRKPLWMACGVAGLAAAASFAVFMGLPTTTLAQAVINQASRFEGHVISYMILPNGQWQRTGEQWIKGGKVRSVDSRDTGTDFLADLDRGITIGWAADQGKVIVRNWKKKNKPGLPMPEILTTQYLKDFLASHGIQETPQTERTHFNGQPADCISFSMGQYEREKVYADIKDHRMLGWSYQHTKVWPLNPPENNYPRVLVVDPKPFPDHIFDPIFNIDGVPTDVLADRAKWQDRLSKPLQVFTVKLSAQAQRLQMKPGAPIHDIAVRSVVANSAGDVFVLFTGVNGDYGTNVIPTTIHDSTGGRYVKGSSFKPSDDGKEAVDWFSYEGKPLEGGWFIRLGGGLLKGPISVGFREEFARQDNLAFTYKAEPERIGGEIPAYMRYMFLPIGTHERWLELRTNAFADDCDRFKNYASEAEYLRQEMAMEANKGPLSFFEPYDLSTRLALALEHGGNKQDAYAMYQKAQKELSTTKFDPSPWYKTQINAGLARLNPQYGK